MASKQAQALDTSAIAVAVAQALASMGIGSATPTPATTGKARKAKPTHAYSDAQGAYKRARKALVATEADYLADPTNATLHAEVVSAHEAYLEAYAAYDRARPGLLTGSPKRLLPFAVPASMSVGKPKSAKRSGRVSDPTATQAIASVDAQIAAAVKAALEAAGVSPAATPALTPEQVREVDAAFPERDSHGSRMNPAEREQALAAVNAAVADKRVKSGTAARRIAYNAINGSDVSANAKSRMRAHAREIVQVAIDAGRFTA